MNTLVARPHACFVGLISSTLLCCAIQGLCFAEIAAKEPSCESAYSYTYVIIGEFLAFIVGWNFILQYIIGELLFLFDSLNLDIKSPGTRRALRTGLLLMRNRNPAY